MTIATRAIGTLSIWFFTSDFSGLEIVVLYTHEAWLIASPWLVCVFWVQLGAKLAIGVMC